MLLDGVTQYRLEWQPGEAVICDGWATLNHWRTLLHDRGVIGQCAERYGGVGFGNVSCRLPGQGFLVSGTQTGHLRELTTDHYAQVLTCDIHRNGVHAQGPVPPSSEAMTHHMIYQCVPGAQFVVHIHAPLLWRAANALAIPVTPASVGYGTPAMAESVAAIIAERAVDMIAMGGHEDGIIAWTADLSCLGPRLCALLDQVAAGVSLDAGRDR